MSRGKHEPKTRKECEKVLTLCHTGMTQAAIAKTTGFSIVTVNKIICKQYMPREDRKKRLRKTGVQI